MLTAPFSVTFSVYDVDKTLIDSAILSFRSSDQKDSELWPDVMQQCKRYIAKHYAPKVKFVSLGEAFQLDNYR